MRRHPEAHPRELAAFLRESRGAFAAIALFSSVANLLMLTGPLFMLQVYDRVLGSRSSSTLAVLFLIVAFLYTVMGMLDHYRGRALARIGARLQTRLRGPVLAAVLRQAEGPVHLRPHSGPHPGPHPGDRQGTALAELGHVQALFVSPALQGLLDLPWTPLFLLVLFLFNPLLGWFALGCVVVVLALTWVSQAATRAPRQEAALHTREAERRAGLLMREIATIRGLGMRGDLTRAWLRVHDSALAAAIRSEDAGGALHAATKVARLLMQSAILGLGAWLVLRDQLTPGAMIAGSILLGRALGPIEQTVAQRQILQRGLSAFAGLSAALAAHGAEMAPMALPRPGARIDVLNVAAVPPGAMAPTLLGVSFSAGPGDAVGVIGPSAAGKSSLARLLTGLWQPAQGEVRLGGARLDRYGPDRLGRLLGYLPQDVVLFPGTVAENIARFIERPDPAAIVAAAKSAGAHEMILGLPQAYDTPLGEGGHGLSGGQRQRIGLARAFFGDPVALILDEPNSALDGQGAEALNHAIRVARQAGKLVIVMSHRSSALAQCNLLLILDHGRMRSFGSRDEVITRHIGAGPSLVAAGAGK